MTGIGRPRPACVEKVRARGDDDAVGFDVKGSAVRKAGSWTGVGVMLLAAAVLAACGSGDGAAGGQASPGPARPGSPGLGGDRPTTTTAAPVTATESAEMWALIEQGLSGEETITCVVSGDDGAGRFYLASDRMFRFDLTGGSDIPSVVSTGTDVFVWVEGEDTGIGIPRAEVQMFQDTMIEEIFGELSASDTGEIDECRTYTGVGVFAPPRDVGFVTIESEADFAELEESAPNLVDLMFS